MSAGPKASLLIVDDEPNQLDMLARLLRRAGYAVEGASSGAAALALLRGPRSFDLLVTDQQMPGIDGLDLIDAARRARPALPVVLVTAFGTVSKAVAAMQRGAADYLTKPFERDDLLRVIESVLHRRHLEQEVAALRAALGGRHRLCGIVGKSPAMQELFSLIERVAPSAASVLIYGESGTGKELVARALHALGSRAAGPFVALNCAAVPENLLEAEFFGHERGAFTGAAAARPGRFEQADGGTLFLDEIGAMRVDLQAKLLRVLQEREVVRLGGAEARSLDLGLVAATSRDLEGAIRDQRFREDLFYRLNVVSIELPPLRRRPEDIALLVEHFRMRASERLGREVPGLAPGVLDRLGLGHVVRHEPHVVRSGTQPATHRVLSLPHGRVIASSLHVVDESAHESPGNVIDRNADRSRIGQPVPNGGGGIVRVGPDSDDPDTCRSRDTLRNVDRLTVHRRHEIEHEVG